MFTSNIVGGHEQLIRQQLDCAVQVDWAGRLVSGQRNHLLDAVVDAAHGLAYTHVDEEVTHALGVECLLHFVLLEFVAREHHPPGLALLQQAADEITPERPRAA